jgi:hypothetical protein
LHDGFIAMNYKSTDTAFDDVTYALVCVILLLSGAFLYARSPVMTPESIKSAMELISNAGLDPAKFCVIRNQCFLNEQKGSLAKAGVTIPHADAPYWFLGQRFFDGTKTIATELADWFEDPSILSEWLLNQQEKMVISQPMAVSPFASLQDQ